MLQDIESFIKETFTPYTKQLLIIAPVDHCVANILKDIGVEPEGYHHAIDRYGLIAVRSYKTDIGLDAILYMKQFDETYYYVEEIRTGR